MIRLKLSSEMCASQSEIREMGVFQLEMHAFHLEMHKQADFHSNRLVSWDLVTEGYQGRPMKAF